MPSRWHQKVGFVSSKLFFTADTHFNHGNILRYCRRPGLSPQEQSLLDQGIDFRPDKESVRIMDEYLLDGINSLVGENDTLYHLGDFCFGQKQNVYGTARNYRDKIRCRNIHIVWGNHDSFSIGNLFSTANLMNTARWNGSEFVLCHYAMAIWDKMHRNKMHLYGHSHSSAEEMLNEKFPGRRSMDVGVDNAAKLLGAYRPFSVEEIIDLIGNKKGHSLDHHEI